MDRERPARSDARVVVMDIDVKIQWHQPDEVFAAVFVRDGEPWFLDGALVGLHVAPGGAVSELIGIAKHLVIEGENFLSDGPIAIEYRVWLFRLLDQGSLASDEMYAAVRKASGGADPYAETMEDRQRKRREEIRLGRRCSEIDSEHLAGNVRCRHCRIEAAAIAVCEGRSDDWDDPDDRSNATDDARAALNAVEAPS